MKYKGSLFILICMGTGVSTISYLSSDHVVRIWLAFIFIAVLPLANFLNNHILAPAIDSQNYSNGDYGKRLASIWMAFSLLLMALAQLEGRFWD